MDFLITPYKSVGPIKFGMTSNKIRELFDKKFSCSASNYQDYYDQLGLKR